MLSPAKGNVLTTANIKFAIDRVGDFIDATIVRCHMLLLLPGYEATWLGYYNLEGFDKDVFDFFFCEWVDLAIAKS